MLCITCNENAAVFQCSRCDDEVGIAMRMPVSFAIYPQTGGTIEYCFRDRVDDCMPTKAFKLPKLSGRIFEP